VTRSSIILRNLASNWAGFAVNAAVTLALTPFVLRSLGASRYGVWMLTASVIGYYGFLDLGFRAGVTQYLTRYLALGDDEKARDCLSSAIAVLAGLGVVMVALSVVVAYLAPPWFALPPELQREAFWCILIVGSSTAIQCALNPFTSIFTATQRFDLANAIGGVTRLATAAGVVAVLELDQGLIGVSAITCVVSVLDYVIRWRVARALAPQLRLAWHRTSLTRIREVGTFGAWNSLISVNRFVYQYVPNLLIGWLMPIAAVGQYALATGLTRHLLALINQVGQVVYPAAAQLHAQGDRERLERLYYEGSRLLLVATLPVVAIAGVWAGDFYRLWIGHRYLAGGTFDSVVLAFRILLLGVLTTSLSNVSTQILMGAGHVRTVAVALIAGSMLNLAGAAVLIGPYGLAGVAAATVIASVIVDLIAIPFLVQRAVGLAALHLARMVCLRPLAAVVVQLAILLGLRFSWTPNGWRDLVAHGAIAGLASTAVAFAIGLNRTERERLGGAVAKHRLAGQWRRRTQGWRFADMAASNRNRE
jgi:O-antigen/teichoic acid export membrane protein